MEIADRQEDEPGGTSPCHKHFPEYYDKLTRDEKVSMAVIGRICDVLDTNIGDVMDFIPDEAGKSLTRLGHNN